MLSDLTGILVPITALFVVFGFLTVRFVVKNNNRRIEREMIIQTARAAVDKGQPLPPEVIASLTAEPKQTAFTDMRRGMVLIALGAGIAIFAIVLGFEDGVEQFELNPLFGIAAIPLLIGVALVVLSRFNPVKE